MSGASDVYAHRRGLMLGLTLAELLLLVLFILLMTYTVILVESENEVERRDETIAKLEAANLELDGQVSAGISKLVDSLGIPSLSNANLDSLNLRLRKVLEDISLIAAENEKLSRLVTSPEEAVRLAEALQEIDDAPKASEILEDWISENGEKAIDGKEPIDQLAKSDPETLADAMTVIGRLQDQLAFYKDEIAKSGNGKSDPSCWLRSARIVYIYDVDLLDEGVRLSIQDDRTGLDLTAVKLNDPGPVLEEIVSHSQFIQSTKKLRSWSDDEGCKFYVRIRNKMLNGDIDDYLSARRIVEGHFYILDAKTNKTPKSTPP